MKIAIIGGGSWGTALAIVLSRSRSSHELRLWIREPELARSTRETRINDVYLAGFSLPHEVAVINDLGEALAGAEIVLSVIPSQFVRGIYLQMLSYLRPEMVFVSATKGIENSTLLRMSRVIEETVGEKFRPRVATLSGPTFAREIARGDPAAVVIASRDEELARIIQRAFSGPTFRLYTNADLVGVEMGGATKNIIAIAAGVCHGLGLGSNSIAALITRGLVEMTRLACACGAQRETLGGLAGLGDLVLTCTGALSRNRSVGVELGKGRSLQEITSSTRMVAEGVRTTVATVELARQKGVEMPITAQMHALLYEGRSPQDAIRELMERTLKHE